MVFENYVRLLEDAMGLRRGISRRVVGFKFQRPLVCLTMFQSFFVKQAHLLNARSAEMIPGESEE
jgi:hypothetical protein